MNYNRTDLLHQAAKREFEFLKQADTLEELMIRGLATPTGGFIVPVAWVHASDSVLEVDLDGWLSTSAGNWIAQTLSNSDRLGFLILEKSGRPTGVLELQSIGSGIKLSVAAGNLPLELDQAVYVACNWARTTLGSELIFAEFSAPGFRAVETHFVFAPDLDAPGVKSILTAGPSISQREAVYTFGAARYGWNHQWSGYLNAFEKTFAKYVGASHCMATSSCTGALHIALLSLEIGPGDEVIVPDITWVATANAVRYVGATPVFADIEEDSWCLDPMSFEQKISPRTKAVIPVHLYGHPAKMDRIMEIARTNGLYVVEDAAPAIGAEWNGQRTGTFGDFGCFSFQGAKLLVTGEGGALVTSNPALYEKALKVWDQGRNPNKVFWIDADGLKYKMSNIQAALGLAQIERCDEQIEMKRRIFEWYQIGLKDCPHLSMMSEVPNARSIYWMSNCRLAATSPLDREKLRAELKTRNIDTRPVFPAISQYPIWPTRQAPEPRALAVGNKGINLPSGVCLTRSQIDYVCQTIRELLS